MTETKKAAFEPPFLLPAFGHWLNFPATRQVFIPCHNSLHRTPP
jgi:hypothetical protein